MMKTYTGGCHCGAVRYEAEIDLSAGTGKCNCSICTKKRLWSAMVRPDSFRLIKGEVDLTDYQFGSNSIHHLFCKHCGVISFGWGDIPEMGGKYYSVNVLCLDNVDIEELMNAPITYFDGLNNNWESTPTETRHL